MTQCLYCVLSLDLQWLPVAVSLCGESRAITVAGARGVASFSKVRGMDVVCLLTIKTINTMTEGYKRYNI